MKELLQEIFEEVIYHKEDVQMAEQRLENEIHRLLEGYSDRFSIEELEDIKSLMYAVQLKSLQAGFGLGAKYTLKLLCELLL